MGAVFCLIFSLALGLPLPAGAYTVLREEVRTEPVASGVTLQEFFQETDEGPLKIYTLNIDLANPYVKVDVLVGADNQSFGAVRPVHETTRRVGAVAALNADFFHLKEGKHPLGITVKDGQVLTSPMLRDDFYAFALTRDLVPLVEIFNFEGHVQVTPPPDSSDTQSSDMLNASTGEAALFPLTFPLAGINKPRYSVLVGGQTDVSDCERLHLYDSCWGPVSRGAQTDLPGWVEVVVKDGVVLEVREDQPGVAIPERGFVLAGHGAAAQFLRAYCQPGARVSVSYRVTPRGEEVQTAVGGRNLLVVNGKPVAAFPKDIEGKFARSAVGFSQDGKRLYLVAVEGGKKSRGMFQRELAEFLAERLGVWRALNLDGGGSTSLAVRPLGEELPILVNNPAQDTPRPVPNALGIFTTAPQGKLAGLVVQGPREVLAGLEYTFEARGYDEYYNPFPVEAGQVKWTVRKGSGAFEGNRFRGLESGTVTLEAAFQGIRQEYQVRVIGPADLEGLEVAPGVVKLNPGEEVSFKAQVRGKDGRVWTLPPTEVLWEVEGAIGAVQNGRFSAGSEDAAGKIRASFLGFAVEVPVTVGVPLPPDVAGHWAQVPVRELVGRDVIRGYPDGTFRPDRAVTRAEFVTILARALGWSVSDKVNLPFRDEIPGWALPGLKAAWGRGVIGGYPDGTFRPDRAISRAELAVLIARALELPEARSPVVFEDAGQIPSWAQEAVRRATAAGILQGSGGYFRPAASATRAEVATLIYQSLLYSKTVPLAAPSSD
ncbi:MAG: phosphodiester glycosidase family protein [Bacillota bacterium]|nr:phosphodiester glycosidase family protein [Bacillota bacterium]